MDQMPYCKNKTGELLKKNAIKLKITIQLKMGTQARAKGMRPTVDDGPSCNEEVTITTKGTVNWVENHTGEKYLLAIHLAED